MAGGGADITRIIWSPFQTAYFAYNTEKHSQIIHVIRYIRIIACALTHDKADAHEEAEVKERQRGGLCV